jgi:hypothetical protein
MKSCFGKVTELVAVTKVTGGQHPFREMSELGPKAGAILVSVTPGYETLVEDSSPGMIVHGVFNVGHVHRGFGF